ncbi:hypothetical protein FB451DRAFT_1454071 [Mycena latifolia]|nr:hypothetical protein FB451DRAFT_1454071 [Mycena latifolia]
MAYVAVDADDKKVRKGCSSNARTRRTRTGRDAEDFPLQVFSTTTQAAVWVVERGRRQKGAYGFDDLRATRSPSRRAYDVFLQRSIEPSHGGEGGVPVNAAHAGRPIVWLSGLLNAIDGVGREDGKLFFATTTLTATTPAHLRQGRIGVRTLRRRPSARALFLRFFPARAPRPVDKESDARVTPIADLDSTTPPQDPPAPTDTLPPRHSTSIDLSVSIAIPEPSIHTLSRIIRIWAQAPAPVPLSIRPNHATSDFIPSTKAILNRALPPYSHGPIAEWPAPASRCSEDSPFAQGTPVRFGLGQAEETTGSFPNIERRRPNESAITVVASAKLSHDP